jgi:hypothetical protein
MKHTIQSTNTSYILNHDDDDDDDGNGEDVEEHNSKMPFRKKVRVRNKFF